MCQERFCKTDAQLEDNRATRARESPKMETQQVSAECPSTGPAASGQPLIHVC